MTIKASEIGKAIGGTELMALRLSEFLKDRDYDDIEIVASRVRDLTDGKRRIFWAHDLPGDPESEFLKDPSLRDRFNRFVFVSNWQMNAYIAHYNLPASRCHVIRNGITPPPGIDYEKWEDRKGPIRLVYFSTPHRGLNILVPAFKALSEKYPGKFHLDVFSSFAIYGRDQMDEQFKPLFNECRNHPEITYHGSQPHDVIQKFLKEEAHVLAYPNTWQETSCLVLIEAMMNGLICVHSNLAALSETGAGLTNSYAFTQDLNEHYQMFIQNLVKAIDDPKSWLVPTKLSMYNYTKTVYDWNNVKGQWIDLLQDVRNNDPIPTTKAEGVFSIRIS